MSRQSDAIEVQLSRETAKIAKAFVLELDRNLRKSTPVDTGHARASWVPSVGAPVTAVPDGANQALHDAGVVQVLRYALDQGALYESTNVPYMASLNGGSSSQAPAGFVEAAIDEAQTSVNAKYASKRIQIDVTSAIGGEAASNMAAAYDPLGGDE